MAWWLEGAFFRYFGWVRNPSEAIFCIFLESGKKSKKKFFQEKSVFIGKIGDFSPIFFSIFPLQNLFQAHRNPIFLRKIGQFRRFFCPCPLFIKQTKNQFPQTRYLPFPLFELKSSPSYIPNKKKKLILFQGLERRKRISWVGLCFPRHRSPVRVSWATYPRNFPCVLPGVHGQ